MSVIEKLSCISNTMTKLISYLGDNETLNQDYQAYCYSKKQAGVPDNEPIVDILTYIFERTIGEEAKSVIQICIEEHPKLVKEEKEILNALKDTISSVFEIKKVLKNGFVFYNLINEKEYVVLPLVKMTNFRGMHVGQFPVARIFKFKNEYYLIEISEIYGPHQKSDVQRYAIAKLIERPEQLYKDNPEKFKELELMIKKFGKSFIECFGTDEIITTNKCADTVIDFFDSYCENQTDSGRDELMANLEIPSEYKYFTVKEFDNSYNTFLEKSVGGFSSHSSVYDVGILYDSDLGLFAIPFYGTLCKIFESKKPDSIVGYKECIIDFLKNDKLPHTIVQRLAGKYKNFMKVVNAVLEKEFTIDELIQFYKPDSLKVKIFSATSALYSSNIFAQTLGFMSEKIEKQTTNIDYTGAERNNPCPCGSGLKYKKCCLC